MFDESEIAAKADDIVAELRRTFGVRSRSLSKALRKTGRRLPRYLHTKADLIVQAQSFSGNPKLMRMVETEEITKAYDGVMEFLGQIDPRKRRINAIVNMLGELAFKVLIIGGLVALVLYWQGFI